MFVKYTTICAAFSVLYAAKILVIVPTPSISHQVVFRPLIQELLHRGHELTVITTDPVYPQGKTPNNLTEIDIHDLSYLIWNKALNDILKYDPSDVLSIITDMYRVASELFEVQTKDISLQKLIRDRTVKFDLLIVEACITPSLIFTHIFKAPVIQVSSFGANPGYMEMVGAETHPFLYPSHFHQRIYNLTFWEKINILYNDILFYRMVKKQESNDNRMLRRIFGSDTPSLNELRNNVDMLFLNVHPIWIHNHPVPPTVLYTWGIHKTPKKILPKDLQSFLDSSKNGVIYISFGTNVKSSTIDSEKLDILLEVFSRLPYNILWKWDMDELPGKSDNIRISKWLPQADVLRHPNLKLFITQGGLQSTDEAINAGVPLIGIPIIFDQEYNTEKYVHFKIGMQLRYKSLTEEELENAIKTVLSDESYRENIHHLRTRMHDQPKPALENAVWWIEYVLRHGGARHLRAPAANMSWTEYYELELVLMVLGGLTALVTLLITIAYYCTRSLLRSIQLKINKVKIS